MKKKSAEGGGVKARIFLIIAAILAIVLLAAAASYSWMYEGTKGTVATFWNDVIRIDEFQMKFADGDWSASVLLEMPEGELKPVCGNVANLDFYTPTLGNEEHVVNPYYSVYTFTKVTSLTKIPNNRIGEYVFVVQTRLRSSGPCDVKISPASFFGVPPESTGPDDPFNNADRTIYGSYGALRIAIFVEDVLKAVWIPNANYEYDLLSGQLDTNGEMEDSYVVVNGTNYDTQKVEIPTSDDGYYIYNGVPYIWDLEKAPTLFPMTGSDEGVLVKFVIWFDGTDRECANLVSGGEASLFLNFIADYEDD